MAKDEHPSSYLTQKKTVDGDPERKREEIWGAKGKLKSGESKNSVRHGQNKTTEIRKLR